MGIHVVHCRLQQIYTLIGMNDQRALYQSIVLPYLPYIISIEMSLLRSVPSLIVVFQVDYDLAFVVFICLM